MLNNNDGLKGLHQLKEELERGTFFPNYESLQEETPLLQVPMFTPEMYKTQEDGKSKINKVDFITNITSSYHILERLYRENNWVALACNIIASVATNTKPAFRIIGEGNSKRYVKSMTELLTFPNLNESGYELFHKTYSSLAVFGNAYWQVVRTKAGDYHSIYSIPTPTIRPYPFINEETDLLEFAYLQLDNYGENVERVFFQEEIIHFKMPNNNGITYGFSQVVPVFKELAFDIETKKWLTAYFQNAFTGGMIFEMRNGNKDQVRRNRTELKEKFEGSSNAGKNLILEGEMKVVWDGNKAGNGFPIVELKNGSRDNILPSLGVPLSIAGVRSDAGQANAEVISAEDQTFLRTIQNYHNIVFPTINLKLFRNETYKKYDLKIVAGSNTTFSQTRATQIVESAAKFGATVNEIREMLGLAPLENDKFGNSLIATTNNGILPLEVILDIMPKKQQNELIVQEKNIELQQKQIDEPSDATSSKTPLQKPVKKKKDKPLKPLSLNFKTNSADSNIG